MRFNELKTGQRVRVVRLLAANKLYRQKLVAMGVIPGAVLTVMGVAPMGDPVEVEVRGTMICLRKDEANIIQIEEA